MAKAALSTYRKKRNFRKTAEPSGATHVAPAAHLRFVVQKHDARRLHYDFRLELDGVFKSWAVTRGPSLDPADKRLAVEVEDHPLDYGDFEGTIPAGEYGGGTVQLWDRGFWHSEGTLTPQQALAKGDLKFSLAGERLRGSWVLVRMRHDRSGSKRNNWLLIKHRDGDARVGDGADLLLDETSVASGRTLEEIEAGRGKAPRPFMLARGKSSATAVWHSHRETHTTGPRTPASPAPPRGVRSVRIPSFIEPQLAKLIDVPPQGAWVHEVKFDGYRMQLRIDKGKAVLRTRKGLDWTAKFDAIAREARALPAALLDGEVVAQGRSGNPSFSALQAALSDGDSNHLIYYVFDALFIGHEDLRGLGLVERKIRLREYLERQDLEHIRFVEHFETDGRSVLRSACRMGLEGIVSKQRDAPYSSSRSSHWLKSKCRAGHEVVLGGWTTEEGTVRSLLAGVNKSGHLVYVGKIGTGYSQDVIKRLLPKLKAAASDHSPFQGDNAPRADKATRWLQPELVAEIEFAGFTDGGMIRQAAFKGLREDKPAAEVVAELPLPPADADPPERKLAAMTQPKRAGTRAAARRAKSRPSAKRAPPGAPSGAAVVMGVPISKPDKVMWPDNGEGRAVTKLDLARYYEQVGEWLLPHLEGRPCSLVRAPDGLSGQQFFQRHAMAGISELFNLVKVKGDREAYVEIDRVEALAAVAQTAALELHPWNNLPHDFEHAGRLVFDLDPAPDVKFAEVVKAALEIRARLERLGLSTFCKTTGGKGLHVVTPLSGGKESVAWPDAKNFAHLVCSQMAHDSPARYLDVMTKSRRAGRIFLDYLRNDRMSTAVAPLSSRARAGATVSMPIEWREVKEGLDPLKYTVSSAAGLLKRRKPWKDYARAATSLRKAIKALTRS